MINVAITGGHTRRAGELIRILINHPDVVIKAVYTPTPMLDSRPVADFHRGLTGETDLKFSVAPFDSEGIDVVFVTGTEIPDTIADSTMVINLTRTPVPEYVYGLPELNRKPLVRGATRVNTPSATATAILLSLLPLAKNLLINSPVTADVNLGQTDSTLFGLRENEIENALTSLQSSFKATIDIRTTTDPERQRATIATVELTAGVTAEHARQLYTEYYDDHNLTHIVSRIPVADDVAGTAKALIHVGADTPSQGGVTRLVITTALDAPLKGSASQAVHIMNLLTRLHEKTGLSLKSAAY